MDKNTKHIINPKVLVGCQARQGLYQRELYDATVKRMYNVVYRLVNNHQETQDVLQEAYCRVFDKIEQFDILKGNILSWMSRICINMSINHIKRNRLSFETLDNLFPIIDNTTSPLEQMEADYILEAIQKLPAQYRIIFNLYEIEGYSHKEIASMIDINVNSCRAYLSRAKLNLQEILQDHHFSKNQKIG